MSFWEDHDVENRVRQILLEINYYRPEHHFGRPFLSAYQLAIEFALRYPDAFRQFGHPLGGAGSGEHYSLASYLAGQLSSKIADRHIMDIEGAFISNLHLRDISFDFNDQVIHSSLTHTTYDLSLYRLTE